MTAAPTSPLAGVRVIDFSRVLSGPIVGRVLADLGADVVKVEPPDGDLTRFADPKVNSISLYFTQQNAGKRNVSLDLAHPEGAAVARRLVERADVVLENFRPGVMARFGLDAAAVTAANPRVVYASITGYGQQGPWADRRAYAVVVHAEAGLIEGGARWRTDATGTPSPMVQDGMSHADVYAGLSCTSAILAALFARERTGRGDVVEVAMADALLFVNDFAHWDHVPDHATGGAWPALAPVYSPIVQTGDGRAVVIAGDPAARGVFERYCRAMGRDDLPEDPRFATVDERRAHRAALLDAVAAWAASFGDAAPLLERLDAAGLANGAVRSVAELLDTDWARERGVLVDVSDRGAGTVPVVQSPFRFGRSRSGASGPAAYRGEHNREVLRELGYSDPEISELEVRGALSHRVPAHLRTTTDKPIDG